MSSLWLVPLVVLALGLGAGLVLARRFARREQRTSDETVLRRADLEAALAETLEILRDGQSDEVDREALELRAAALLREIEQSPPRAVPAPAPAVSATPVASTRPMLVGALYGGGLVALVAALVALAVRDAKPAPQESGMVSTTPSGAPMTGAERGEPPLPPVVTEEVERMRAVLAERPADVETRRALAQLLLAHEQYFDAFSEARTLLEQDPTDPEGLYTSAIVRYTMGQADVALEQLRSVTTAHPEHVGSWLVQGLILLQLGDREAAVASWESGLTAAGGSEPRLEHLLRLARENRSAEEILATPPPAA